MKRTFILAALGSMILAGCTPPAPAPVNLSLAKAETLKGNWAFTYTLDNPYTDAYVLSTVRADADKPGEYYLAGIDEYGELVVAGWHLDTARYSLLDGWDTFDEFYTFDFTGATTNTVAGCIYFIRHADESWSECISTTGARFTTASTTGITPLNLASARSAFLRGQATHAQVSSDVKAAYTALKRQQH